MNARYNKSLAELVSDDNKKRYSAAAPHRTNREYEIYAAIAKYMKLKYPGVLFRFDAAGLNLSRTQAGKNKAIQGDRGWPDFFLAKACKGYHGLVLEIKVEGKKLFKKDGVTHVDDHVAEQIKMIDRLIDAGYKVGFVFGTDHAILVIDQYLEVIPVKKPNPVFESSWPTTGIIEKEYEPEQDDELFWPCDECDLPDACEDFGCAIRAGVRGSMLW